METSNEKHGNSITEKVSDIDSFAVHQPEDTSEQNGLVSVVYHALWSECDKKTWEEE